jgi:hypothetical protein
MAIGQVRGSLGQEVTMRFVCAAVVLTFACSTGAFAADQTWAGEISDSHCGAKHPAGETAKECTEGCVRGGASYVFVSSGKVYKLEDPSKLVAAHAGQTVSLTGEMKGDMIKVSKIETGKK